MLELKKNAFIIWTGWLLLFACFTVQAQKGKNKRKETTPVSPSVTPPRLKVDTTGKGTPADSAGIRKGGELPADSIQKDTVIKGDLQTTVLYVAEDSTIMEAEKKEVHLYGNASVTYGEINLKADYIRLNWITNEVYAKGREDTTSRKMVGEPVFQDGPSTYTTKELRYNFKTKKGIIRGIVTQEGDGNIRGDRVKKDSLNNFYIRKAIYTTCNLTHPHFYINAPKIKLVEKKQVVSGLFNLVIGDVPLPIGLPFGFFPLPKNKEAGTSGILFPSYGEDAVRGFYLRDGGYYFAISEYINASVTGQYYTSGSWGIGLTSNYISRYKYSGSFSFRFNKNRSGDEVAKILGSDIRNDFSLQWSHTPKPRGSSTFSANVNIGSNSYNSLNARDVNTYISNVASSSVQYNKTFGNFARAGASLRVNQNFGQIDPTTQIRKNGTTNVSTDFNFGINQFSPFTLGGNARGRWYESFRLGMDFSGSYGLTNTLPAIDTSYANLRFIVDNPVDTSRLEQKVLPIGGNIPTILQNGSFQGRYSIPISLPNMKLLRYINITPSFSFQGELFTKAYSYTYKGENRVRIDTTNTLATQYSYSFGAGANTRFYGLFHVRKGRLETIRHTVIPNVSFSYTPDFSRNTNFYQKVQINEKNETRIFSRYRSLTTGGNGKASAVVNFGLSNQLEMKLRTKSDTAENQFEKVSLLDNFSINGNYNLMADSLKLSNITVNANTRIGKNLNMNFNMNFDPYIYEPFAGSKTGVRVNKYAIQNGQGLARLQNLNFTMGTSFNPASSTKKNTQQNVEKTGATEEQLEFIDRNPELYVDFNIPWNITVNYNFGWTRTGLMQPQIIQALNFNGDLSLTPKWKITVSSGFDFAAMSPTITQLTIYRDLHCWDMSLSWTPYAGSAVRASNYNFTLKVKSSILQDLKLTRRRSFYDTGGYYQ